MDTPKPLLHLEGLAVLAASVFAFAQLDAPGLWFAILFLAPDLFMVGYLLNARVGAVFYNIAHTYTVPIALIALFWFTEVRMGASIMLVWTAHIGFDRMLGFGLKYKSDFKDTHLQRVSQLQDHRPPAATRGNHNAGC